MHNEKGLPGNGQVFLLSQKLCVLSQAAIWTLALFSAIIMPEASNETKGATK
jgi:hypothetical protein